MTGGWRPRFLLFSISSKFPTRSSIFALFSGIKWVRPLFALNYCSLSPGFVSHFFIALSSVFSIVQSLLVMKRLFSLCIVSFMTPRFFQFPAQAIFSHPEQSRKQQPRQALDLLNGFLHPRFNLRNSRRGRLTTAAQILLIVASMLFLVFLATVLNGSTKLPRPISRGRKLITSVRTRPTIFSTWLAAWRETFRWNAAPVAQFGRSKSSIWRAS
jgi:hypothetical protein